MKVTSLDTSKSFKPQIAMLAAIGVASVLSGIAPASRAVWFTEMFWAWGLVAILLLTWRRFRFSTTAYSCFFKSSERIGPLNMFRWTG